MFSIKIIIFVQSLKMISVCKTAIENQVFYHFKSISFNYLRPCREILKDF